MNWSTLALASSSLSPMARKMCLKRVSTAGHFELDQYTYLGSRGRRKSERPASILFCLTQSSSQEGRTILTWPLFANEATFTVPIEHVSQQLVISDGMYYSYLQCKWCLGLPSASDRIFPRWI